MTDTDDRSIPPDWACVDCLFYLADGVPDESWTKEQCDAFAAKFAERNAGYDVTLGMFAEYHGCKDEAGEIADDCECEQMTFSWSSCVTCGSTLGGARHAVTFHPKESS